MKSSTNFACASSRLWSVMVMIWCRIFPMSCFLPSASVPSWMWGSGSVTAPCTECPAKVMPLRACIIRPWSSMSAAAQSMREKKQIGFAKLRLHPTERDQVEAELKCRGPADDRMGLRVIPHVQNNLQGGCVCVCVCICAHQLAGSARLSAVFLAVQPAHSPAAARRLAACHPPTTGTRLQIFPDERGPMSARPATIFQCHTEVLKCWTAVYDFPNFGNWSIWWFQRKNDCCHVFASATAWMWDTERKKKKRKRESYENELHLFSEHYFSCRHVWITGGYEVRWPKRWPQSQSLCLKSLFDDDFCWKDNQMTKKRCKLLLLLCWRV